MDIADHWARRIENAADLGGEIVLRRDDVGADTIGLCDFANVRQSLAGGLVAADDGLAEEDLL